MAYFSIIHILIILLITIICCLFIFLGTKHYSKINLYFFIGINVIIACLIGTLSMFVVDKYTKTAKLEKITHTRALRNESIVFRGIVRNTGRFDIGSCKIEIKIINNMTNKNSILGQGVLKPTSGLGFLFGSNKTSASDYTRVQTFTVANNLRSGRSQSFTVSMPFPTKYSKPSIITKLNCR